MSNVWEHSPAEGFKPPKEFLISLEVYVPAITAAAMRKPAVQRKKLDRRDSLKPLAGTTEDRDTKKVKGENADSLTTVLLPFLEQEKSSWISLAKASASGQWRAATCKLTEDGDRCLLNVYIDEAILYQTVHIHLLNHTDIQQADTSLFFKKDCLGIYCVAGQRWSSIHTSDLLCLGFANTDACHTWLALLKSYAIPEIYGRSFFPEDGGSYRMWRQVDLTVIQGRNLGNPKPFIEAIANTGVVGGLESYTEPDAVDLDVSCEVHLNNTLCGRTTVKKGIGSPDWHESFAFSELPPFQSLEVIVWREKRLFKPTMMGTVRVMLNNFRRGETVEGWFPVLHNGPLASDLQVGDVRLKIRVLEEIILPYGAYQGLLQTFNSRNFLDWMADFETKLRLKTISHQLMSIAVAKNVLIEQVFELADREVDGTPSSHHTLFRGNTILTKIMELCMAWYGKAFLEASIGDVLRRLCAEKVVIEVDPLRSGKGVKDVERNVELLIYWCQEFWKQIYSVREECPNEMRRLFEHIRKLVKNRYRLTDPEQDQNRELPLQSVSAFCFLRFIVPAILHPHLFSLCPGLPSASVQRSLTLIAKVIQSLANLNAKTVQKEEFMRGVKDFLKDSQSTMIDYILVVSTPSLAAESRGPHQGFASDRHNRLSVVNTLRQRAAVMPVLDRESIPILPNLLDIPRDLAMIASAVIRNSRDYIAKPNSQPEDRKLEEFCSKCYEVEEYALHRVSHLATRISSDRRRPSPLGDTARPEVHTRQQQAYQSPRKPPDNPRPSRRQARPSTAPSISDTDLSRPRDAGVGSDGANPFFVVRERANGGLPSSSAEGRDRGTWSPRVLHKRSISTESIPSYGASPGPSSLHPPDVPTETSDEAKQRKRGLLRGILNSALTNSRYLAY